MPNSYVFDWNLTDKISSKSLIYPKSTDQIASSNYSNG